MQETLSYAVYYGIGQSEERWEDDYYKIQIIRHLPKDWDLHLFARLKKGKELIPENVDFHYVYDVENFDEKESEDEIIKAEKWLGYPLSLLLSHDKTVTKIRDKKEWEKQLSIAAKYVKAWRKLFEKNDINLFSTNMESGLSETTAWATARALAIPMVNFGAGRVFNSFVFYDENFCPLYWRELENNEKEELQAGFRSMLEKRTEVEFKQTKEVIEKSTAFTLGKLTDYSRFLSEYSKMKEYEKTRFSPPQEAISKYAKMPIRKMAVKTLYEKADYSKKYFFLPLQYENEAQQLFREPFLDQYAIIRNISKLLPAGVLLYVKTHPHLQGIDVALRKLLSVAKLPNVRIVHHDENPVKLVMNSVGLITINSTTGFEAIALGKPVIAFGHDWYAKEGIVFVVRDMMRLRDIICDIVENPSKYFDEEKRKEFVSGYLKQLMPIETPHRTIIRMKDFEAESIAKELFSLVNRKFI